MAVDGNPVLSPSAAERKAVSDAFGAGRRAHGTLAVDESAFAAHARRCAERRVARKGSGGAGVRATEGEIAMAIAACVATDVYLAVACLAKAPDAWERLQALHAERLVALAISRGASGADAEHRVADLLADVAIAPAGGERPPLLDQYDGSGTLFSWLATCLLRRLAPKTRRADATHSLSEATAVESDPARDPARVAAHRELEDRLRLALRRAVTTLTVQENAALVLSHRDGWSGKDVARMLGVGAPRASRLRAQATEKVRREILPVLRDAGVRGVPDGATWDSLRDAVGLALGPVTISRPPAPLPGESPPRTTP